MKKALLPINGSLFFLLILLPEPAFGQAARVQFIHASPYAEAAVIDVYRNGELWLDDFAFTGATPLADGPNFSVDWLADEVGLSRRQLERRVEAVVGETPAELVRRLRLERSSQLLRARAGTVSEVGFRSAAHFSRVFRAAYGELPSEHMHTAPVSEEV